MSTPSQPRPKLLDLFCGAGGCSMGYYRAGFDVVGVDIKPQPHYPFKFIQEDALSFPLIALMQFDAIHASPPCQFATTYRNRKGVAETAKNLIPATRELLRRAGVPYVIENVYGARTELRNPVMFCGSSFRLDVQRHRMFEASMPLLAPPCAHDWPAGRFPGATNRPNGRNTVEVGVWRIDLRTQQEAMGIDWMNLEELSQAIPPAYTEHIGKQLITHIEKHGDFVFRQALDETNEQHRETFEKLAKEGR